MISLVAALTALAVFTATMFRPQIGAFSFLLLNPLIVGVARGEIAAFLRPNELLLLLILAAALVRFILVVISGQRSHLVFDRLDVALIILAATSSIVPLLVRYGRGLEVSQDDLLYSLVLWKYLCLFRFFRSAITTTPQVERCLWMSVTSAAVAAVIGIFQVMGLFAVPEFLHRHYDQAFEGVTEIVTERATSTLASSFGFVDVMIMNLLIALALLHLRHHPRWLLVAAASLFLSSCIMAGQFSGLVGLAITLFIFGLLTGRLLMLLALAAPVLAVAAILFWPVISHRLEGFAGPGGLPRSWVGRWDNLTNVFLPELATGLNWLLGVQPAARLPAPEPWRDWIYIESGYVWLLWIGGIPFFGAFIYFVYVSGSVLRQQISERSDIVWVASVVSFSFLMVMVALMLLDPHLTVRGAADLFFPLLALSAGCAARSRKVMIGEPCGSAVPHRARPQSAGCKPVGRMTVPNRA